MRFVFALLGVLSAASGQTNALAEKSIPFHGVVTDVTTKLPIQGVAIEFRMAARVGGAALNVVASQARVFNTNSNARGEFALNLPVGGFRVTAAREGYSMDATSDQIAEVLDLADANTFAIKLVRSSFVSGFTEDEAGKAVASINVELIDPASQRILRVTSSTDGSFRLGPVAPGNYVLRGNVPEVVTADDLKKSRLDGPPPDYALTYYPSMQASTDASPIAVSAGQDLPGLRLRMRNAAYFTVSGRVVGNAGAVVRLERASRSLFDSLVPAGMFRVEAPIAADGAFRIERVVPGNYRAVVYSKGQGIDQYGMGGMLVNVNDRSLDDLTLVILPAGRLEGRIILENGEPTKRGGLITTQNDAGKVSRVLQPVGDGRFAIDGVSAGTYRLSIGPVTKIDVNGRTFEGNQFDFAPPQSGEMVVTVNEQGATIGGILERADDKPVSGVASVMPMAAFTDRFEDLQVTDLSLDGSFAVSGLSPGKYLVCVWSEAANAVRYLLQWTPAPLQRLEQQCKPVTLQANASELVQVRMTSIADVTR